jgi:hypothetical protein
MDIQYFLNSPVKKKAIGIKSGNRDGQFIDPPLPIHFFGKLPDLSGHPIIMRWGSILFEVW